MLQREEGPVVVYLFPRSKEITAQDRRIEFDAKLGRLEVSSSFFFRRHDVSGQVGTLKLAGPQGCGPASIVLRGGPPFSADY